MPFELLVNVRPTRPAEEVIMRKPLGAVLLLALVLPASTASARTLQKGGRAITAPSTGAAVAKPASSPAASPNESAPAPTLLRMPGTIEKYESATRTLTLGTQRGPVRFVLAAVSRILRDGQSIDATALEHLIGFRAAVRYSISGSDKAVESVHVFRKAVQ